MLKHLIDWFDDRAGIRDLIQKPLGEPLPKRVSLGHVLGRGALFLFALQVLTGILLATNYAPSPDHAYESVQYIMAQPFGKIVRGLHHWSAWTLIVLAVLHLLNVFFRGAYKKPRELTWVVGVMLLFLVMCSNFTGLLLPWDQRGYWARKVEAEIVAAVPVVGSFIKRMMLGGEEIGAPTLTRFYAAHVSLLPMMFALFMLAHWGLVRRHGLAPPPGQREGGETMPYFPYQAFRDSLFSALLLVVLLGITLTLGVPMDPPADPAQASYSPRPEWYIFPIYQFAHQFDFIWGKRTWVGAVILPGIGALLLLLLPFIDRNPSRLPRERPFALSGAAAIIVFAVVLGVTAKVQTDRQKKSLPPPSGFSGLARFGEQVYDRQKCWRCHAINGKGAKTGPELLRLKKNEKPKRSKQWLIKFLLRPDSVYPDTKMPPVKIEEMQSLDELEALAEYLTHFKTRKRLSSVGGGQ